MSKNNYIVRFSRERVGIVLQQMYEKEVSALFGWIPGDGIGWQIGNDVTGWMERTPFMDEKIAEAKIDWNKIEDSISALAWCVKQLYPKSAFADWYRSQQIVIVN